jgi:hypothetical protein
MKTEEFQKMLEEFGILFVEARNELLMSEKWNSLSEIAEELNVPIRYGRICIGAAQMQNIVVLATDDLLEILERKLKEAWKIER